ncbi:response regulator [Desulfopila sp. IMCC35006]|uniref:response regulator n=1 Tax=Desulfopila sp. IMCC35006 TaxID=2569542 RepID=UPI0010ABDDC0|nr:response regulator [Desulfopila sp. IMCC35006]TKB28316.1 response regulator [Desulfopila sp. IMCC35006]
MNNIAILLVEGRPEERMLIRKYLSPPPPVHFDLREAETLKEGLSLLARDHFDVILLDLELPDSSGLDTARRVITKFRETPVIVLSNPEDEALAQQAVSYGTEDYIEKNFLSSALLLKSIRYAMERKKIIQEKYDVLSDLILALEKIDSLESLLPICIGCKKIYHEDNRWVDLEEYVRQSSNIKTTRATCPDCQRSIGKNFYVTR